MQGKPWSRLKIHRWNGWRKIGDLICFSGTLFAVILRTLINLTSFLYSSLIFWISAINYKLISGVPGKGEAEIGGIARSDPWRCHHYQSDENRSPLGLLAWKEFTKQIFHYFQGGVQINVIPAEFHACMTPHFVTVITIQQKIPTVDYVYFQILTCAFHQRKISM